jgi:hypothetical protein
MFSGFMSKWTMPLSWMYLTALPTPAITSQSYCSLSCLFDCKPEKAFRLLWHNSIHKKTWSPSDQAVWYRTIFGWLRVDISRISCLLFSFKYIYFRAYSCWSSMLTTCCTLPSWPVPKTYRSSNVFYNDSKRRGFDFCWIGDFTPSIWRLPQVFWLDWLLEGLLLTFLHIFRAETWMLILR